MNIKVGLCGTKNELSVRKLMIKRCSNGYIVILANKKTDDKLHGMCIASTVFSADIGEYRKDWDTIDFVDFDGSIDISNY